MRHIRNFDLDIDSLLEGWDLDTDKPWRGLETDWPLDDWPTEELSEDWPTDEWPDIESLNEEWPGDDNILCGWGICSQII